MTYKSSIHAEHVTVKAKLGFSIHSAVSDSIELAGILGCLVTLEFNDRKIACEPWDKVDDKLAEYFSK